MKQFVNMSQMKYICQLHVLFESANAWWHVADGPAMIRIKHGHGVLVTCERVQVGTVVFSYTRSELVVIEMVWPT